MARSSPVSQPVRSLTWEGDDLVDIAAGWRRWRPDGSEEPLDGDDASSLAPGELGIWSLTQQAWIKRHRIDFRVGTLLGCQGRALGTYGHLKLIAPATATVLAQ
jgi:hypothetical protein